MQRGEREFVDHFPVQLVVGADGDFVQIAQHVQLGQGDVGCGLHLNAIAGGYQIDGADPAGTAGLRTVLEARLPEGVRFGTEHLTDEGAFAHAGGVGFHNADDLVDLGGGQTGTHRGVSGDGVGGGGVGVNAVVQIPQSTQLGFKQDFLPLRLRLAQIDAGVADEGLDLLAVIVHPRFQLVHGDRLSAVNAGKRQILPLQQILQMLIKMLGMQEFSRHNGLFLVFIGVKRRNALLGGAVLLILQPGFLQTVLKTVPGQQQRRPVADFQVVRGDGDALLGNILHFLPQVFRVNGDAVSQDVHDTLPENAGGQQMQGEFAMLIDHGVAGVAAALITDDDVIILGEQIDHASLALVTPVDADDYSISHLDFLRF